MAAGARQPEGVDPGHRRCIAGKGGQAWKFGILSKDLSLKGFQAILAVPGLIRFFDG